MKLCLHKDFSLPPSLALSHLRSDEKDLSKNFQQIHFWIETKPGKLKTFSKNRRAGIFLGQGQQPEMPAQDGFAEQTT